jgi:hypothetical protein
VSPLYASNINLHKCYILYQYFMYDNECVVNEENDAC